MSTHHADIFTALLAPFRGEEVKSRPQGGRQLQYITARTAMNRLDEVLGPENWWDEYRQQGDCLVCRLSIRLPGGEVVAKEDAGGAAGMSDAGDDDKSQFSDAFKRAAVKFGVGRYLYRDGVPRLRGIAGPTAPAAPAGPAKQFSAWAGALVDDVNARWLKLIGDGRAGSKLAGEIVTTWQLSGHLMKWARAGGLVVAPADVRPGDRDRYLAVAWKENPTAIEEEARQYCRHLWRQARAGTEKGASDEPDGEPIPDPDADPEAWPEGRE